MTPSRFTERQKGQMVEQYRAGSSSVDVGKRFGCSDRTVMRIVRSRLSAAELETCKARSYKKQARSGPAAADTVAGDEPMDNLNGANNLPWADADDFVESGGAVDDMAVEEGATALTATGRHRSAKATHRSAEGARGAANLDVNTLPSPLYLLVERSVELQPQTLGSLHHLAPLDKEEQQRQGLILFSNVRQARRQCRRNQRIVKLADPRLLGKTAPHLLAQGISRLVVEGALYVLPGSTAGARP